MEKEWEKSGDHTFTRTKWIVCKIAFFIVSHFLQFWLLIPPINANVIIYHYDYVFVVICQNQKIKKILRYCQFYCKITCCHQSIHVHHTRTYKIIYKYSLTCCKTEPQHIFQITQNNAHHVTPAWVECSKMQKKKR